MRIAKASPGKIQRLHMSLWKSLGSCPRCVRSAFRVAFMAWVLTGIGQAIPLSPSCLELTRLGAILLTTLWMAHLFAHAIKVSAAARPRQEESNNLHRMLRRDMLPMFARALTSAALATSIPTLAFADCDHAALDRCQAAVANCRANCDRAFHREEPDHACHQECYSTHVACKSAAKCP
jgi:hypothetical protein